jgi:3-methyladenine DNA glycosylase AlkD
MLGHILLDRESVNTIAEDIIDELRRRGNPAAREGMRRFAIGAGNAFGVSIPVLRGMARAYAHDHKLAEELWRSGWHEARLLAVFIDDPRQVTREQMERWCGEFNSWDITDQACNHLFRRTPFVDACIRDWAARDEEFVRRAAFALIAGMAVHGKRLPDEAFLPWLALIAEAASDERNFVKKAVNWALRQIGKRNAVLHARAIAAAEELLALPSRSAKWIARDALKELRDERIIARINTRATV